jgi:CspA family cold shock protein
MPPAHLPEASPDFTAKAMREERQGARTRSPLVARRVLGCLFTHPEGGLMAEGTIKRLTDKGFGFIETSPGKDIFFHMSAVQGVRFEDLRQGQRVSFTEGMGPKGPRAENVKPI